MNKKKVLLINHSAQLSGGAEFSFLEYVTKLADSKDYNIKVSLPQKGELQKKLKDGNINCDIINDESWRLWYRNIHQIAKIIIRGYLLLFNLISWINYLKREKPDLIHININRIIIPLIAARLLNIKTIIHFRDIVSKMRYKFVFGSYLYFKIMNLSEYWIANSQATKNDIRNKNQTNGVFLIHNFIDLNTFDKKAIKSSPELNKKYFNSNHKYRVVMLGGLNPWKNQIAFVKAAINILKIRKDIYFFMFGKIISEEFFSKIATLINKNKMEDFIIYAGFSNDIPSILNSADIMLHTMQNESFGRIFIEAMAAKKPVITFNSGGAKDIILDGETGILVENNNIGAMSNAIELLIDNPELRLEMGIKGRKRVEDYFSQDLHMKNLYQLYDKVL